MTKEEAETRWWFLESLWGLVGTEDESLSLPEILAEQTELEAILGWPEE